MLEVLGFLNRELKKTIVMVTHDPEAATHASRTLHLNKGQFVRKTRGCRMTFLTLARRNAWRKPMRTLLLMFCIAVAFLIYGSDGQLPVWHARIGSGQ
ncbi:hypothetical protein [Phaeobacter inhibens]|uniref:hypothetical protein n=1 Tax=Phaeobacter inhibens TaxID=221822 RepID=UPI0021A4DF57|nr:hypothetical protein [Phaeobacter inhibens]